ncbi:hypothetical protein [Conexibacter sp. CPCC 206217]|uniref:hypothetical protein n=1 Tax=Conexibacter sp. CPCC 206217 TaxID=3064574 RepID=UPI0027235B5B|nr:hypothetical protein [Conexibacter sp. CPCC 206217]MDO8214108.1 hypothetical protein [Conexibacter sp. CPCC 206217]
MSTADAPTHAQQPATVTPNRSDAPLLFVFLLPMLAIVGMVLWIGQSPTWLLVGVAIATIAVTTGFVMLAIKRLLDDGDGEGHRDVVPH